jgi:hypothetical protein
VVRPWDLVDGDGTRANRSQKIASTQTMVDRIGRRFDPRLRSFAGETFCGAAELLKWLIDSPLSRRVREFRWLAGRQLACRLQSFAPSHVNLKFVA